MLFYNTSNLPANLMNRSFTANLMRLRPNGQVPLLALSGMAQERVIRSISHFFWMKRAQFPQVTIDGNQLSTDTNLVVLDSSQMIKDRLLIKFNITPGTWAAPEVMRVTAVPDSTHVTVERNISGTGAVALADGDILLEVGSNFSEGSSIPDARSINVESFINITQIFRDAWKVAGTTLAVSLEPDITIRGENRDDAMWFHAENMEYNMIFSRYRAAMQGSNPIRNMSGIEEIVQTHAPANIAAMGATTTFKQLCAALDPTLDTVLEGSQGVYGTRAIFAGPDAFSTIKEIGVASGEYELVPDSNEFGVKFHRFNTRRGTFEIKEHPLFSTHPTLRKMAMVSDLSGFDIQWLRKTAHQDVAFDGTDAVSGVFTSEATIELRNPTGWGFIYNLGAAA